MNAFTFDANRYVRDLVRDQQFDVSRDIFRDPEVFDREMKYIFESSWVFVGLACQLPKPYDFITTWIGRQPVIVSRDESGKLHCFLNTCRHRGSLVCHTAAGSARRHVCPYHGWAYDSTGRCVHVKDDTAEAYGAKFAAKSHDLMKVAHFGEYRGFLFASLGQDAPPLDEHLGDMKLFLDLLADQSPDGIEIIPGVGLYTYNANWKLQLENCLDGYHFTSTHPSLLNVIRRRKAGESRTGLKQATDFTRITENLYGSFLFRHGHAVVWTNSADVETHLLYDRIDEIAARVGKVKAEWMLKTRNSSFFPNVQFADNGSLQLRIIRPLAADRTEMRTYCLAPVGEGPEKRARRIRLYEDFFNSTGLATPDDTQVYEDCQTGYQAFEVSDMQGYDRGMPVLVNGADQHAKNLGISPQMSTGGRFEIQDEVIFHSAYREWLRLMSAGAAAERVRSGA